MSSWLPAAGVARGEPDRGRRDQTPRPRTRQPRCAPRVGEQDPLCAGINQFMFPRFPGLGDEKNTSEKVESREQAANNCWPGSAGWGGAAELQDACGSCRDDLAPHGRSCWLRVRGFSCEILAFVECGRDIRWRGRLPSSPARSPCACVHLVPTAAWPFPCPRCSVRDRQGDAYQNLMTPL